MLGVIGANLNAQAATQLEQLLTPTVGPYPLSSLSGNGETKKISAEVEAGCTAQSGPAGFGGLPTEGYADLTVCGTVHVQAAASTSSNASDGHRKTRARQTRRRHERKHRRTRAPSSS